MSGQIDIWASLPVPAVRIDANERIADLNTAAEGFFNTSSKAMRGVPVWDAIAVDAPLETSFQRARDSGAPLFVNDVDVGTGTRLPVQCALQIAPVVGVEGEMLMLISPRELAGRMTQNHSVKSAAQSAIGMAEMLAHEIKNPLAGITGAAQLISMQATGEDLELTDLIVAETRRIVKLLEQVEDFGNLRPPDLQGVNLHDVLDRARKSASVGFAAHMDLADQYDPSLPLAQADPDQLLQVVLNILKNAAQAGSTGGRILIRTFYDASLKVRRPDGTRNALPLQIEIVDDGPGIPPEIAGDIFEPFVSGRENGTGLGLALVSKIISDHDGLIALDSVPGRTVFRISLAIHRDHVG